MNHWQMTFLVYQIVVKIMPVDDFTPCNAVDRNEVVIFAEEDPAAKAGI